MKLTLHLKIFLLLAWVVACTHVLVGAHQQDHGFGIDAADTAALRQQADAAFTRPDADADIKS